MNIFVRSELKIDKVLKQAFWVFVSAILLLLITWVLFYWLYPWDSEGVYEPKRTRNAFSSTPLFSYELIGTGALALNPQQTYGWVTDIARELIMIAHNSRPDILQRDRQLLVSLKHHQEPKHVVNGKIVFLETGEGSEVLKFSDTPQSLWMKPILLDDGGVLIEVGRKLGSLDAPHSEEKGQFVVQMRSDLTRASMGASHEYVKALKEARGWGFDQLMQKYGGREFTAYKEKYKLDFSQAGQMYACFVSSGDRLVWEQGRWRVIEHDGVTTGQPLALITSASGAGIEIKLWDENGFFSLEVRLPLEQPAKLTGLMQAMPAALRLRTATQVSCLLGKKRLILRQGDWVLKTASGWKILRQPQDIEHCLSHQLRGELLIFDSLEKEQGRWVLKAEVFDEMRTAIQTLRIPIEVEKKTVKAGKKRKLPFATKSAFPLWFLLQMRGQE